MSVPDDDAILRSIRLFRETLRETQQLFVEAGQVADRSEGRLARRPPSPANSLASQMNDLHLGFLMKIFAQTLPDPSGQSLEQRQLGRILLEHLWGQPVMGGPLREGIDWLLTTANGLSWYDVTRPFLELPSLRDYWGDVETMAIRLATMIAVVDGREDGNDRKRLNEIQAGLDTAATSARGSFSAATSTQSDPPPAPADSASTIDHQADIDQARNAITWLREEAKRLRAETESPSPHRDHEATAEPHPSKSELSTGPSNSSSRTPPPVSEPEDLRTPEQRLADARAKLDRLIGLEAIKNQIQTLANFLNMEKHREQAGLPTTRPSLHMAFVGNPGTGKTTVARIIAEIYGALGVLTKGHLVETDRSGLVAEYAGQTGPKTNAKIDEALDGVLFIDEAYTLVDENGQDQYGREAVQTLLKRMEDQRERLVVILAGYPREMTQMIRSNPGLSSRVGTTMHFDDYDPQALGQIFELIASKAKYELPTPTRRRLLRGFAHLYFNRDRHFGNGRTSRNAFERTVRRLANRISTAPEITRELLVTIQPEDIELPGLEDQQLETLIESPGMIRVLCGHCEAPQVIDDQQLGTEVLCPLCGQTFWVAWGSPVAELPISIPEVTPGNHSPDDFGSSSNKPLSPPHQDGEDQ